MRRRTRVGRRKRVDVAASAGDRLCLMKLLRQCPNRCVRGRKAERLVDVRDRLVESVGAGERDCEVAMARSEARMCIDEALQDVDSLVDLACIHRRDP